MKDNDTTCEVCVKEFTYAEWDSRHTDEDTGGDVHEYCCTLCVDGIVACHLKLAGYDSLEEWASDSDYTYNATEGEWYDEWGYQVNIVQQLLVAVDILLAEQEVQ